MTDAQDSRSPFDELIGLRLKEAGPDRVVAVLSVTPSHHQPYGIVHGGVYATAVETTASWGAAAWLGDAGRAVGIGNSTQFLRAVRQGELRVEATPLSRGRTTQLWQVDITDERGRLVARGEVRLLNLRPGDRAEPTG